jgi:hypothetical protein
MAPNDKPYDPEEHAFPKMRHRPSKETDPKELAKKPYDSIMVKTPDEQEALASDADGWSDDIEGVFVNQKKTAPAAPVATKGPVAPSKPVTA